MSVPHQPSRDAKRGWKNWYPTPRCLHVGHEAGRVRGNNIMTDADGSRRGYCGRGLHGEIVNRVYAGRESPVESSWKDGGWGTSETEVGA